jgi:hypothetical protein
MNEKRQFMKIITKDKAYVQIKDLNYLSKTSLPKPISIETLLENSVINSDCYEFLEFNDLNDIAYFKNLDWLIDYNEVKNLSSQDLCNLALSCSMERKKIINRFYNMYDEDKLKNLAMMEKCDLLEYKINSFRDMLLFRQKKIAFKLPDDIEEKGFKKILKIFKR